jgi:hypothetical protein
MAEAVLATYHQEHGSSVVNMPSELTAGLVSSFTAATVAAVAAAAHLDN